MLQCRQSCDGVVCLVIMAAHVIMAVVIGLLLCCHHLLFRPVCEQSVCTQLCNGISDKDEGDDCDDFGVFVKLRLFR